MPKEFANYMAETAPDELIAGAKHYLVGIPGTLSFHIGKMVRSHRDVTVLVTTRTEMAVGIRTLLDRFPALRPAQDTFEWRDTLQLRGPQRLVVTW